MSRIIISSCDLCVSLSRLFVLSWRLLMRDEKRARACVSSRPVARIATFLFTVSWYNIFIIWTHSLRTAVIEQRKSNVPHYCTYVWQRWPWVILATDTILYVLSVQLGAVRKRPDTEIIHPEGYVLGVKPDETDKSCLPLRSLCIPAVLMYYYAWYFRGGGNAFSSNDLQMRRHY